MNKRKRLFRQLYPSFALAALGGVVVFTVYTLINDRSAYLERVNSDALIRLQTLRETLSPWVGTAQPEKIDQVCKRLGAVSDARVTIVSPDGVVVGDSRQAPADVSNMRTRPEIISALAGEIGAALRFDVTTQVETEFVAAPFYRDSAIVGAVRIAVPLASRWSTMSSAAAGATLAVLIGLAFAGLLGYLASRRITAPLQALTLWLHHDSASALPPSTTVPHQYAAEEIADLQDALSALLAQQKKQIADALRQTNEQRAIFQSMSEGVFAIDMEERIVSANRAVCEWFGLDPARVSGLTVQETARNTDLERIVRATLIAETDEAIHDELTLISGKILQSHGVPLHDESGKQVGVVIMLHDVTDVRKLESVRSEFVANVSHELKTPITSIKGYIETLLLDDERLSDNQRKFLEIAARQSDRLQAIIDDLLTHSRIERESELERETIEVEALFKSVSSFCKQQANQRSITITANLPDNLSVSGNARLLEQALINLLDNALKYSEPNTTITLEGLVAGDKIVLRVIDEGVGIEEKHLPRLFERFYRTDRARNRKGGGSGLGLAIVKHIALAHGGRVEVESTVGKGSTFSIILPKRLA